MKKLYKFFLILSLFLFFNRCAVRPVATIESERWNYEIEAMPTGLQGTYQVLIWTYTSIPERIHTLASLNAVHGIIFRGYPAKGNLVGNEPLVTKNETKVIYSDFFDRFFSTDRGEYREFVSLAHGGAIQPGHRIRINRRTYKIGIVANINVQELRRELERNGIIRALDHGF